MTEYRRVRVPAGTEVRIVLAEDVWLDDLVVHGCAERTVASIQVGEPTELLEPTGAPWQVTTPHLCCPPPTLDCVICGAELGAIEVAEPGQRVRSAPMGVDDA